MFPRTVYTPEHEDFRLCARRFLEAEVPSRLSAWERQGHPDRELWRLAGEHGLLGYVIPQQYGGLGGDRRYGAVLREEMARVGVGGTGLGMPLHADVIAPFIVRHGSAEQKERWLPRMVTGEVIGALAMTERCAGSDSKNIATSARRVGGEWVVNGSKIFITNGSQADLLIAAVRTDDAPGAKGISLMLIETDRPGFSRSGPMPKTGLRYEDAAELFFRDVRLPASALLGEAGTGFSQLMHAMAWERVQIALMAVAVCENVLEWTLQHVRERQAFDRTLFDLQNTRFKLAECMTETRIGRQLVDRSLELECSGQLDPVDAAMAKYWCTELQGRVLDQCLQLHGGWGVMAEHRVARAYVDARVTRIYGGANEVLKEVIARSLP